MNSRVSKEDWQRKKAELRINREKRVLESQIKNSRTKQDIESQTGMKQDDSKRGQYDDVDIAYRKALETASAERADAIRSLDRGIGGELESRKNLMRSQAAPFVSEHEANIKEIESVYDSQFNMLDARRRDELRRINAEHESKKLSLSERISFLDGVGEDLVGIARRVSGTLVVVTLANPMLAGYISAEELEVHAESLEKTLYTERIKKFIQELEKIHGADAIRKSVEYSHMHIGGNTVHINVILDTRKILTILTKEISDKNSARDELPKTKAETEAALEREYKTSKLELDNEYSAKIENENKRFAELKIAETTDAEVLPYQNKFEARRQAIEAAHETKIAFITMLLREGHKQKNGKPANQQPV